MSSSFWREDEYRLEVWERERSHLACSIDPLEGAPPAGELIAFFYAPTGAVDPGLYGWGVILHYNEDINAVTFRVAPPSDTLKVAPWAYDVVFELADAMRGKVKQGTLFCVSREHFQILREYVFCWLAGGRYELPED